MPKKSHKKLLRKGEKSGKKSQKGGVENAEDFFILRHPHIKTFETRFRQIINNYTTEPVTSIFLNKDDSTLYNLENKNYKPLGSPFFDGKAYCQAFIEEKQTQ
tara:strand:- start:9341 stop:9649 length:309 start_codon:yes stop_codon:yes gene_type:complete